MTVPKLDNYQSPLGALIEDAQEDRGISSREAALMCGVSHTAYYHWKGGALPNLSNIPVLSAFCRVPAAARLMLLPGRSVRGARRSVTVQVWNGCRRTGYGIRR